MNEWISIKNRLPLMIDDYHPLVLLAHTLYGTGLGSIYRLDDDQIEGLESEIGSKYICSFFFVKPTIDENGLFDVMGGKDGWRDEDVFEDSPHFRNLGTITHWMHLPDAPDKASDAGCPQS